jgi:6-phosphofructokinase 2
LDTSGAALHAARGSGIYLVKPNLRELGDLLGRQIRGDAEEVAAARELIGMGLSEVVVLSLGPRGALLVSARGHERFPPIEVPVLRSAVGAGDSMVAALTLALVRGLELREAVGFGMAAGAAALMTPGTELCRRDDVERLFAQTGIGQGGIPTGKGPSQ